MEHGILLRLVGVMISYSFDLSRPFSRENPTYVISLVKTLTLACIQTFADWFLLDLVWRYLIEIATLYIFTSLSIMLTFIQSHSCIRNIFFLKISDHFLANVSIDLDGLSECFVLMIFRGENSADMIL